jgi:hypothetical protein
VEARCLVGEQPSARVPSRSTKRRASDVDWLSGARSHALEILINQTIEFAPIVLLGAAPEVALIKLTRPARKPAGFGIAEPFPGGYLAQQIHAFLPRPKMPTAPTAPQLPERGQAA